MIASPRRFVALPCLLVSLALLGACGGDDPAPRTAATSTTGAADATTTTASTTTAPEPSTRTWIANVKPAVSSILVYDAPAGARLQLDTTGTGPLRQVAIDNPLPSGAPTTFRVLERDVGARGQLWHRVELPVRPNGSSGWVSAGDVTLTHTDLSATIRLGAKQLELRDGAGVVATYPVAIGEPATPTPTGTFYVKELVAPTDPDGSYGPLAYGLSAHSDALIDTEAFADGVIGIHGTNTPELIGSAVSHGCVRMRNEDILDLQSHELPLGMPVTIEA